MVVSKRGKRRRRRRGQRPGKDKERERERENEETNFKTAVFQFSTLWFPFQFKAAKTCAHFYIKFLFFIMQLIKIIFSTSHVQHV